MTNSCRSFALKLAPALVLALAGCTPSDGLNELSEGRAAYSAGDFKRAEKLFRKSAELAPSNVDALVEMARLCDRVAEIDEATDWIARAEALAAGDVDVRLLGAQIACHARDFEKAERLYRGVAEDEQLSNALRAEGWVGLGVQQATANAHDLARISYLRAIRLDRRNAAARYNLGHLYRYAPFGYAEAAQEQFDAFVHLSGEMADARVQKTQRTIIPGLKETIARAAAERPGVSRRNSAASATALSRAEAASRRGQWKSALASYQEALTSDPLSYPAAIGLARTQLKVDSSVSGQKKALESYRVACSLRPSAVSAFVEAGALAEKLVLLVQAREFYSRAVAANPASLDAVDGLIRALRKANVDRKIAQAYQAYRDTLPRPKRK